ncbi:MAG: hypothetical protein FWG31_00735 [Oscillospiraceae bacterium]|nr:hypothetical protein [Oscillospiraceae bacterium]
MSKTIKIIAIVLCAELAVFAATFGVSCIPRHIRQEIAGLEILLIGAEGQNTGDFEPFETTDVTVRLDGWLQNRWFANPRYKGTFEVSGYPLTMFSETEIVFTEPFSHGFIEHFSEPSGKNPIPGRHPFGLLFTDKDFSFITVWLMDVEEGENGGFHASAGNRVIAAPAADWDAARERLLQSGFFWMEYAGISNHNPPAR